MPKKAIVTDKAPKAIGPYSQGIYAEEARLVFCSGQIPIDPATGKFVEGGITEQTRRSLENIKALLSAANTSFDRVVKTTVFLTSMADFQEMNAVYAEYFPAPPPARSTVAVVGLPMGARVEIEVVALA